MSDESERRVSPRHSRRLQVRFWLAGEETATSGMTANLSATGTLITAPKVYRRGTRLRLELQLPQEKVMIEGEVAHGHRIPVELRALGSSAMGIRFLSPDELLGGHLQQAQESAVQRAGAAGEGQSAGGSPARKSEPASSPRVYAVRFAGVTEFLDCFYRDLSNGGLFVRTHHPREMQQVVELRFHLPGGEEVLRGRGRVVHTVPSAEGGPGGMGLELIELARLLDQLRPEVERLEAAS